MTRSLDVDPALARSRDDEGRSAFVLAHVHGHEGIGAALQSTGLELDIVEAVLAEDWERFDALAVAQPGQLAALHPVGGTPLHAAALCGSLDLWRLRSAGCLSDAVPEGGNGYTAARTAMESARSSWARIALADLCSNGADVNALQRDDSSVLHGAVQRKDATLVLLAIRKGARVDAVDDRGRTASALALELGWNEGARLLADHSNLPRDNRSSRIALNASREPVEIPDMAAVPDELQSATTGSSHFNFAKVRELIGQDARLTFSLSTDDELPVEACAHTGNRPIIRFHLDHGAPLSLPTAVSLGDTESVKFWLRRDPTLTNERGAHDFPVMWYALLGRGGPEMAELLVRHGVSVEQESMGTTTLHWCARRGDHDLAKYLLENGADAEAIGFKWDRGGQTPLQLAGDDQKMAAMLRSAGARV